MPGGETETDVILIVIVIDFSFLIIKKLKLYQIT
jgi:hypothetical protein